MLGKRDPEHYGTLTLIELEVRIRHWARAARPRDELLPHQLGGRVRRAPAPGAGAGGRPDPEPRRVDPLQLCDPRRARDRRTAGGGGAPVGRRRARGVAPAVGDLGPRRGACLGQGRRTGTGRRSRLLAAELGVEPPRPHEPFAGRADLLAQLVEERGLDLLLVTEPRERPLPDRVHRDQRRLPGGPAARVFLTDFRYVERARAEVPDFDRVRGRDDMLERSPRWSASSAPACARLRRRAHDRARPREAGRAVRPSGRAGSRPAGSWRSCAPSRTTRRWRRSGDPRGSPTRSTGG